VGSTLEYPQEYLEYPQEYLEYFREYLEYPREYLEYPREYLEYPREYRCALGLVESVTTDAAGTRPNLILVLQGLQGTPEYSRALQGTLRYCEAL
jgi:hypothetical protein